MDTVELLISKEADINIKNNNGDTAFHIAMQRSHLAIAEFLISKGSQVDDGAISKLQDVKDEIQRLKEAEQDEIRKQSHLWYKIFRANNQQALFLDFIKYCLNRQEEFETR